MKKFIFLIAGLIFALALSASNYSATKGYEAEPNNSFATANGITAGTIVSGAINTGVDEDYFTWKGLNSSWGIIALLDTSQSTGSTDGELRFYSHDAATVLGSDSGSWENGSGIALANFGSTQNNLYHFIKVNEDGQDAPIDRYNLRVIHTIIGNSPREESEPNDAYINADVSTYTNAGAIDVAGDKDCYAFHGNQNDTIVIALNSAPDDDSAPENLVLTLYGTGDTSLSSPLKTANESTGVNPEFIEYGPLPTTGKYVYCVEEELSSQGGPDHTYYVGITRNYDLYRQPYSVSTTWINPGPEGMAHVGDTMTFRLSFTNESALTYLSTLRFSTNYDSTIFAYQSASIVPDDNNPGYLSWGGSDEQKLAPGETYSIDVSFTALKPSSDQIRGEYAIGFLLSSTYNDADYIIASDVFLPMLTR